MIPVVRPAVPSNPMVRMKIATSTSNKVKPRCDTEIPTWLFGKNSGISINPDVARCCHRDPSCSSAVCYRDFCLSVSCPPAMKVRCAIAAGDGKCTIRIFCLDVHTLSRFANICSSIGVGVSNNLQRVVIGKDDRIGDVLFYRLRSRPHKLAKDLTARTVQPQARSHRYEIRDGDSRENAHYCRYNQDLS